MSKTLLCFIQSFVLELWQKPQAGKLPKVNTAGKTLNILQLSSKVWLEKKYAYAFFLILCLLWFKKWRFSPKKRQNGEFQIKKSPFSTKKRQNGHFQIKNSPKYFLNFLNTKLSYISILQKLCEFRTKSVRRRIQKGEWTFFFATDKIKLLKKSQMCDDVAGNYYHWKEEKNICENADIATFHFRFVVR